MATRTWINIVFGTMVAINRCSSIHCCESLNINSKNIGVRLTSDHFYALLSAYVFEFLCQKREVRDDLEPRKHCVRFFGLNLWPAISETNITKGKESTKTRVTIVHAVIAESLHNKGKRTVYYIYSPRMTAENQIPWNCLTVNDDTEAFMCLRKIQRLTNDLKQESKCDESNEANNLLSQC